MSAALSAGRISLHGAGEDGVELKPGTSSAIIFKLNDSILRDLKKASQSQDGISFATGTTPQLRIGNKTIDLDISPDAFRNELYTSTTGSGVADFRFSRMISHRAQLKSTETKSGENAAGTDAALAALQQSLASYEQEKQAKQANITNSILPTPKNRFDAARRERLDKKRAGVKSVSQPATPPLSATAPTHLGSAPTSAPVDEENEKMQAMKTPLIHLIAMGPVRTEEVAQETHIPKDDLDSILQKVGKLADGKWQLTDRTYKDLDVWKFAYTSKENRQAAIDNAVKAFDRMRLGKDDRLWQMLLPKRERDKGIVLSRLHKQVSKGLTPLYQPSPMPHAEGASEGKLASGANTPRLGGSTPRPGSSKGDVMKRLLSKDPKKARAAEEEKERKRKEREAAASDREVERRAKKPNTKKTNPNVKSAEFVHSSDDDSDDVGDVIAAQPRKTKDSPKVAAKSRSRAVTSTSSDSSDTPIRAKMTSQTSATKTKSSSTTLKPKPSPLKASAGTTSAEKRTPQKTGNSNNLSAPNSQQKTQASPRISDSRPSVPSPLGAARPRVASDVSDRDAFRKVKQGGETPKGLGISNGGRQKETNANTDSLSSNKIAPRASEQAQTSKKTGSGTPTAKQPSSSTAKDDSTHKRKAETAAPSQPQAKHRKVDSTSSQSQSHKSHASSAGLSNGTARTSLDGAAVENSSSSSSDTAGSVLQTITYSQGVNQAERFRDTLYPAYAKLYDEQAAMEARGEKVSQEERERLLKMHKRLEQIKREIKVAAQREHGED